MRFKLKTIFRKLLVKCVRETILHLINYSVKTENYIYLIIILSERLFFFLDDRHLINIKWISVALSFRKTKLVFCSSDK